MACHSTIVISQETNLPGMHDVFKRRAGADVWRINDITYKYQYEIISSKCYIVTLMPNYFRKGT